MSESTQAESWVKGIKAITLFVEDLAAAKAFYQKIFALPVVFEGDTSVCFQFGDTIINLLVVDQAPELIAPEKVASPADGARIQFTIEVDDVDAMSAELVKRGAELVNGPVDRPWGIRTACFKDPGGHLWEIAR
jgi:catechol 2,3-dioxygenase-like lactoylglutathione lyase family enzyme